MNYIGVDIGGTKCAISLGWTDGDKMEVVAKKKFATGGEPMWVLGECLKNLNEILAENNLKYEDIVGIGISCGGPLDSKKGLILSPPNLPDWDHIEIVKFFEENTGIATALQNDANACAIAEWRYGAGKGLDNMIFLTFGTGLGAGLILDGKLYSGTNDMAGEVGHIRLEDDGPVGYNKAGSSEGFCSGGGIGRTGIMAVEAALARGEKPHLLEVAGEKENITAKMIAELAFEGDELCKSVYEKCGQELGKLLSMLIDAFNPQRIVLGGVFMRSSALIRPAMEAVIEKEALSLSWDVCDVVPAGLGESIGDYAALGVASLIGPKKEDKSAALAALIEKHPALAEYKDEIAAIL